jgi:hypothetical protein
MKNYPNRPAKHEERYVDFDDDSACWGIFGADSGHCYALFASEQEAEDHLEKKS